MRSPHTTTKSSPHSLQLEKAHVQQWRPNAAKKRKRIHAINHQVIHSFPSDLGILFLHPALPNYFYVLVSQSD